MNVLISINLWRFAVRRAVRFGTGLEFAVRVFAFVAIAAVAAGITWTIVVVLPNVPAMDVVTAHLTALLRSHGMLAAGCALAATLWLSQRAPFDLRAYRYLPVSLSWVALHVQIARLLNVRCVLFTSILVWIQFALQGRPAARHLITATLVVYLVDAVATILALTWARSASAVYGTMILLVLIAAVDEMGSSPVSAYIYELLSACGSTAGRSAAWMGTFAVACATLTNRLIRTEIRYES